MKERLDKVDLEVLRILQDSGRITNAELAKRVGLSPPSMLQRVRRLEDSGFITGYVATVNHERLGFPLVVMAMVRLAMHQDEPIEKFIDSIKKIPEVLECHHVSGDYDFMMKIVARDMHDYERIVREKLSKVKSVGRIHSCFVLNTNKDIHALPL
ncbi:MAG: Lrp/AsnC family transcriptional regulator [Fimbriimonadaceae bacterium]